MSTVKFNITRLQFKRSERYPYVVRVQIVSPYFEEASRRLDQITEWLLDSNISHVIAGYGIYLPSMKEAEMLLLRWTHVD